MKQALADAVEPLWVVAFRAAGRLARPQCSAWSSPGAQRVLVLAPHPDDEAVGCAGTLLRHRQSGDQLRALFVTDGRASRALGLPPDEMARRRRQEAEAAAQVIGLAGFDWLGLPEGAWPIEELCSRLASILREYAPQLIYAPSRIDFHPDHFKTAHALALSLSDASAPRDPVVRVYQIQVPLTLALAGVVVSVDEAWPHGLEALKAYATQWDSVARSLRMRRYAAAYWGGAQRAEEFWQMSAEQYVALHSQPPERWPAAGFRSLRARPWADPLSYLRGLAERRRLAEALSSGAGG
jgi:LmbE family N-acetylglucosaminyl deacetylase